jgi:3-oxoacyl-[acyl-carrier protein] reductase
MADSAVQSHRVALVTGASGALGGAVARLLDASGYSVGLHYLGHPDPVIALQNEMKNPGTVVQADVTCWDEVALAAEKVARRLGPVDVLVNTAGMRSDGLMATQAPGEWRRVIEVNLLGTFHMCRAVIPRMLHRRWGRVINVVSPAGLIGSRGQTAYSASKAGVVGLTRSLAVECGRRGVTVNALSPGFMHTAMTGDLRAKDVEAIMDRTAISRPALPGEVAAAVNFIIDSEYMTGQTISVDGGVSVC